MDLLLIQLKILRLLLTLEICALYHICFHLGAE